MRETPVASAKIAVDHARRRPCAAALSACPLSTLAITERIGRRVGCFATIVAARDCGPFHDAEPQTAEEARPLSGAATPRESPLPLDGADVDEAARDSRRRR